MRFTSPTKLAIVRSMPERTKRHEKTRERSDKEYREKDACGQQQPRARNGLTDDK